MKSRMAEETSYCQGNVIIGWSQFPCKLHAAKGSNYCRRHDPVLIEAKRAENARWDAEASKRNELSELLPLVDDQRFFVAGKEDEFIVTIRLRESGVRLLAELLAKAVYGESD